MWRCLYLPWHRFLFGSFWVSERAEVITCSCGRQYAVNHELRAVIAYDDEVKAFYGSLR